MTDWPSNPVLDTLEEYFTDTTARAQAANPHAPWIDLSIGDPNEPTPAFIRQALIDAIAPVSNYPTTAGSPRLRQAVADWVARRHGVEVDPNRHVLPASGSKEAIFHLPLAVIDANSSKRHVLWGQPGYPVYARGAQFAGGISDAIALDDSNGWRLELAELAAERLERAAIAWCNYPHNPTGATVDVDYFRRQRDTAREHGIVLASDECYQELWFDTPAPSVLEACDGDFSGVLAFVSLSKRSGMTGYRSGAIIGDEQLIAALRRLRVNIGTASPTFIQAAAIAAWNEQEHVNERRQAFADKRHIVAAFLHDAGFHVAESDGTFYLWVRAPDGDDVAYAQALANIHIVVTPGRAFGPAGAGWFRIALVPTVDECREAVVRWQKALDDGLLPQ